MKEGGGRTNVSVGMRGRRLNVVVKKKKTDKSVETMISSPLIVLGDERGGGEGGERSICNRPSVDVGVGVLPKNKQKRKKKSYSII